MSFVNIPRPEKRALKAVDIIKPLSEIDTALLNELFSIFNRSFISFYTNHDFNGTFGAEHWNQLSRFCDTWDDVTHEFVDKDLELNKKQLYDASLRLASVISQYTSPISLNSYSVYPTQRVYSDKERERFREEAAEINNGCPAFVAECESFIRYARKRLSET
ncbi:MAG: hypothetical protein WC009_08745 [Methylotenera sp.]